MSSLARKIETAGGPLPAGPVVSRQSSKLLPDLFRSVDPDRRLTVLEIGPALAETVDFFSQFKCRLHFVDLFNQPFVREQQSRLSEKEMRHAFEEQLRFPSGTQIDICLLWDFLCYLDDAALRGFNSALHPWLHPGSRAHGFGVHHLAIRVENVLFGVIDRQTLSIRNRQTSQMKHYPHSQIEMHDMLSSFDFERGLLLPEGKLEMLLKARN